MKKELNLEDIQIYYNEEHTWEECCIKFNVSWGTIYKYKKNGKLIGRSLSESNKLKRKLKPYVTSQETKEKISISLKKYLKENKGNTKWVGNDSHASLVFKKILSDNNITFVEEFIPLDDRYFRIDIAFPDKKIGIEINGEQHYERNGSLREYYQNRHNLIENSGWKLYEISHYLVYKKDFLENFIKELVSNNLENVDYSFYIKNKIDRNCICGEKKAYNAKTCWECYKKNKTGNKNVCECGNNKNYKPKLCIDCRKNGKNEIEKKPKTEFYCECGLVKSQYSLKCLKCHSIEEKNRKVIRPCYEQLLIDIDNMGYTGTGRKYGVSDNSIRKWVKMYKKYGEDF